MKKTSLFLLLILIPAVAYCCECAFAKDARGFCQVIADSKDKPMFCITKARVISYYEWGMYVEVLDNIYNTAIADTILIWGDNGACCRPTFTGLAAINIGDTLVMSLEQTDFVGNFIAPGLPDYEDSLHYMLGGCGAYYLRYHAGKVFGGFADNVSVDTMDYDALKLSIHGCLPPATAAVNVSSAQADIHISPNPALWSINIHSASVIDELLLLDGPGKIVTHLYPGVNTCTLNIQSFPTGIYTLVLHTGHRETISCHKIIKQ